MSDNTRIGATVAGYRIQSLIGRGGMSIVYLAEHVQLGRRVALKALTGNRLAPSSASSVRIRPSSAANLPACPAPAQTSMRCDPGT